MIEIRDIKPIDPVFKKKKTEPTKKDKDMVQQNTRKPVDKKLDDDNDEQHVDEFV